MKVRRVILVLAALSALQVWPWTPMAAVLPSLSPLLSLLPAIAGWTFSAWVLPGVVFMVLAWLRGRWFCIHVCPVWTLLEGWHRWGRRTSTMWTRFPRLGRWLVPALVAGAFAGYPLAVWVDPLSLFHGFFGFWKWPVVWTAAPLMGGLLFLLVLEWFFPRAWCERLCALGALQTETRLIARSFVAGKKAVGLVKSSGIRDSGTRPAAGGMFWRREFLAIAGGAVAGGWFFRRAKSAGPIRPPGAADEWQIGGLCSRCGNCVRVCPQRIIHPALGAAGLAGFLTPVIRIEPSYCNEWCNECNQVCPTGTIRRLSLDEKRLTCIGMARIDRELCMAWMGKQQCKVCHAYCPYQAIAWVAHNGIHCPVVKEGTCRGCGACQKECPVMPGKAIRVYGPAKARG